MLTKETIESLCRSLASEQGSEAIQARIYELRDLALSALSLREREGMVSGTQGAEGLKLAQEIITRDDQDNASPSRTLRPGTTEEYKVASDLIHYAYALREATSIGIANLLAYCGAYESLSQDKQQQWDRLDELAALTDGLSAAPPAGELE